MKITITLEKDVDAEKIYDQVITMAKREGFGILDVKVAK